MVVIPEMGDFSGADPSAVWQDLKFTPTYVKELERFALVGDKRWHKVVTELSDKLGFAEAEFFEVSQLDQAWDWIGWGVAVPRTFRTWASLTGT